MAVNPGVPAEFQLVVRRRCKTEGCDGSMEGRAPNAGKCLTCAGAVAQNDARRPQPRKHAEFRWRHGRHSSLGF
jgi:hypothetical protein